MEIQHPQALTFENIWKKKDDLIHQQVVDIWKRYGGLTPEQITERLPQLVYVVKNEQEVVGISTAYKTYVKQLKNYLYAFRCMVTPHQSVPGLDAKLTVLTRDFLESIHQQEEQHPAIGVITVVENPKLKERTWAVWPASQMVYIGNSKEGHHVRVYYFKGARI